MNIGQVTIEKLEFYMDFIVKFMVCEARTFGKIGRLPDYNFIVENYFNKQGSLVDAYYYNENDKQWYPVHVAGKGILEYTTPLMYRTFDCLLGAPVNISEWKFKNMEQLNPNLIFHKTLQ